MPMAKWAWQDASPQGGFNWLLTRVKHCALKDVMKVVHAQTQLIMSRGGALGPHYDDEDFEPSIGGDDRLPRQESNALIAARVGHHVCIPVSSGQSHTSLEDKAAMSTHQFGIDCSNVPQLERELDRVISDTTDMGVEVGTAEFHFKAGKLDELLPPWFFGSGGAMASDAADLEDLDRSEPAQEAEAEIDDTPQDIINSAAGWLRRNEMPIPGCNHILDSITRDAHHNMKHFNTFLEEVHEVEQLLADPGRRERFAATCLLGTRWADDVKHFRIQFVLYWPPSEFITWRLLVGSPFLFELPSFCL